MFLLNTFPLEILKLKKKIFLNNTYINSNLLLNLVQQRREDVTTVDGAASGVTPTGYVHIEAPLERSASAFAAIDEVDTRVETIQRGVDVESVQREVNVETIQRGLDAEELMARSKEYERDEVKARAYSSKSGGLDDIDAGDDQKPVQLNLSDNKGPSQVGAVLTRPETPRRQGATSVFVLFSFNFLVVCDVSNQLILKRFLKSNDDVHRIHSKDRGMGGCL